LVGDAIPDAAPVADTTEPVLTTTPAVLSDSTSEVSPPADSGNLTSGTLATNASAAPGADITSPVLASTGDSLPATDLSPEGSTDQAAGPADTLLALATADAPIEVPQAATAPASDAASAEPIAFEGDVIALDGAEQPPENALFTGTQYTDYGVTLSSNIEIPQQTAAASSADAASTQDTAVPIAGSDVHQPAPAPDVVDTTTPIDHLGLRDAVL